LSGGALLPGGGRDAGGRAARGTAFEQVYGDRFFDYLARHPEQEATFQASMSGRAEQEAGDVVAAYDFGGLGRLVDVGGGYGILLGAVLRATPELQAVLVDQPGVVAQARRRLEPEGLAGRCELVAGDFFASVPAGADAYLLSRVLHDWVDDDARRLPERARDQPAVIRMDLHMLVLLGAHERTEAQYRRLLGETGFRGTRVVPTASPAGLSVIEAVPAD